MIPSAIFYPSKIHNDVDKWLRVPILTPLWPKTGNGIGIKSEEVSDKISELFLFKSNAVVVFCT